MAPAIRDGPAAALLDAAGRLSDTYLKDGMSLYVFTLMIIAVLAFSNALRALWPALNHGTRLSRGTIATMSLIFFAYIYDNTVRLVNVGEMTPLRFGQLIIAGGLCAFTTHTLCTPIDVVKTRLQTNPAAYEGPGHCLRTIIRDEGPSALLTGLGATSAGYFLHGAFKYPFYELFKLIVAATPQIARMKPPLHVAAVCGFLAEIIACVPLAALEAIRIRSVSDSTFPRGVLSGLTTMWKAEGLHGLYKGFPSVLLKQVPYTVGQFVAFEFGLVAVKFIAELFVGSMQEISSSGSAAISLAAGLIAGVIAGVISQPGDTILSKINQGESEASAFQQIYVTAKALGFSGLFLGLGARTFQVSCMIGGQFMIYDSIKLFCGIVPASSVPASVANAAAKGAKKIIESSL